jgi:amidophosphoribosyltransferase
MCGFVGITGLADAAPSLALAIQAVQHRGQDAAGIGVYEDGYVQVYKELGMVTQAIGGAVAKMSGGSGVVHVRYPTAGGGLRRDAQPFMTRRPSMVLAHNGNVTNMSEVEEGLAKRGIRLTSNCDAEAILGVFADALVKSSVVDNTTEHVVMAVREVYEKVRGGYSVVAVMEVDGEETLVAFRDPHGIRPGVYGQSKQGAWAACSESVSLDVLGYQLVGDLPPGCCVLLRGGQEPKIIEVEPKEARHCIFEDIYFARPDSRMRGHRVYQQRWELGQQLALEWQAKGFEADVVVAVPDTSRPAAHAIAEMLGAPCREGFIKNRYSGRTFIMPDQEQREIAHRLKLNPIREIFEGQRVLLVDDSVVRGTTMRRIAKMVQGLGPLELHLGIFSPAVRHPCFYGIDMPTEEELVASKGDAGDVEARLAAAFGVDSVTFLSPEGLQEVAGKDICSACFTGHYPVAVTSDERSYIQKDRRGC